MGAEPTTRRQKALRSLDALKNRDFAYVFAGQAISMAGDAAFYVVIGWYAYKLGQSGTAVSVVLGSAAVAMLASLLFGGFVADRFDRRRVMILADLVRAAVIGGLGMAVTLEVDTVPMLAVAAGLVGVFDGIFSPAFNGIVPALVTDESLESANGLLGLTRAVSAATGPMIASALYGFTGAAGVFWADAVTFVVAAWCGQRVRPTVRAGARSALTLRAPLKEIAEGARYVLTVPLLASIPVAALALMVSDAPTQSLLPVIVERHFHSGLWVLAGMSVALGLGTAAGSLAYAHFKPGRHGAVLVFTAWAASHVVCAAIVLQGNASVAVALSVVRGVLSGFGYGLWSTLLMRIVPDDKLSRVFSIDTFGCMALMPVGFALSGVLIERTALAATTIVAVGQLVAAALMAAILLRRSVRTAA